MRTFVSLFTLLRPEAEVIDWYKQRISAEKDSEAKAILENAQQKAMKHFGLNLEFLLLKKSDWIKMLQVILFQKGDLVKLDQKAKKLLNELIKRQNGYN